MTMKGHSLSIAIFFCWAQNICKLVHFFHICMWNTAKAKKTKRNCPQWTMKTYRNQFMSSHISSQTKLITWKMSSEKQNMNRPTNCLLKVFQNKWIIIAFGQRCANEEKKAAANSTRLLIYKSALGSQPLSSYSAQSLFSTTAMSLNSRFTI